MQLHAAKAGRQKGKNPEIDRKRWVLALRVWLWEGPLS
jgi:hypothetical protein